MKMRKTITKLVLPLMLGLLLTVVAVSAPSVASAQVKGLAGIATGVLTFFWPSVTAQALLSLIAAWAILTGAFEVVAAVDLRNVVEGERQLAWGSLIEREMMGAR